MRDPLLPRLGAALRQARLSRGLTQAQVAHRVGRAMPRISELESDLLHNRPGRDRLALLADVCDALGLALVAVPRERLERVEVLLDVAATSRQVPERPSVFDELFIDLSEGEAEQGGGPAKARPDREPR